MRVSRIDDPEKRMFGWLVRFSVAGQHTRKFFSDLAHEGSKKAEAAAEKFALAHLEDHSEIRSLRSRLLPRRNTPHGVPGVARYVRAGGTSAFWTAYWTQDGVRRQKKFSIAIHGEREARELAFATRDEMTADGAERLVGLLKIHTTEPAADIARLPAPQHAANESRKSPPRRSRPADAELEQVERRSRA